MPLVLTDVEVERLADMSGLVLSMERAFVDRYEGSLMAPPRHYVEFGEDGRLVFTVGGIVGSQHLAGFRVYDTFRRLSPDHSQLVAVWDSSTGELKGIILGDKIGALRTGAIGGVAIKYMASAGAQTIGIIGSGQQARTQLQAAACVRNIKSVKVYSRSQQKQRRVC
jgi:ornithine cyclodeaminase